MRLRTSHAKCRWRQQIEAQIGAEAEPSSRLSTRPRMTRRIASSGEAGRESRASAAPARGAASTRSSSAAGILRASTVGAEEEEEVVNENFESIMRQVGERGQAFRACTVQLSRGSEYLLPYVDGIIGVAIILNAILLGASADFHPDSMVWIAVDIVFAVVFLSETTFKMCLDWRGYLCGHDRRWNWFELALVAHSLVEIPLSFVYYGRSKNDNPILSNIRYVRLVRFARIFRLGRLAAFKELIKILTGAMGGIRTFFWSIVLIMVPLYVMALALRESLGDQQVADPVTEMFATLPMAMFTVFRCIVAADCQTETGRPIFVLVAKHYGWGYGVLYCMCMLLVVFGLFNVITAIYIDNTLSAAKYMERRQKQLRLLDQQIVAKKLVELLEYIWRRTADPSSEWDVDEVYKLRLTPETYEGIRQEEDFQNILRSLDICDEDQIDIFETLDVDRSGTVDMEELVVGITKMRGDARRSDVVGIILIVKSIQAKIDRLIADVGFVRKTITPGALQRDAPGSTSRVAGSRLVPLPRDRPARPVGASQSLASPLKLDALAIDVG